MVRPRLSHLVQSPVDVVPSAVVSNVYTFTSYLVGKACDGEFGCVVGDLWVYGMEECLDRGGRVVGGERDELGHTRVEEVRREWTSSVCDALVDVDAVDAVEMLGSGAGDVACAYARSGFGGVFAERED